MKRVRAAAAESAAGRNALDHADARADTQSLGRLDAEVAGYAGIGGDAVRPLDLDGVGKRNRQHHGPEVMVAVRPQAEHLQRQVDLGVGLDRQRAIPLRSRIAESTAAKSLARRAVGTVEKAMRMSPERTMVPTEYFSISRRRTDSASTPIGFTHIK